MKKLLLAIYIILVVTASLASRADLRMMVKYPNACVRQARAVLMPSEFENVFYIEANASHFGDGCIRNFAGAITEVEVTDINARALKFELQRLNKDLDGVYTIMTRDGSFKETIDFANLDASSTIPNAEISGILLSPNSRYGENENLDVNKFVIEINTTP
jgi:hypothetical protein